MKQLFLNYIESGEAVPDHKCEEVLLKQYALVNGTIQTKQFNFSTNNIKVALRRLIKQGKIDPNKIDYLNNNSFTKRK